MKNIFIIWGAIAISFVMALVSLVGGNHQSLTAGNATPGTRFPHGITVGLPANSPNNIGDIKAGTCALIYSNPSVTASTTRAFDCAVTGIVSTDYVFVQTSTTTVANGAFVITGASASTTAGFITLQVTNLSPTAALPREIASSTPYLVIKTQ